MKTFINVAQMKLATLQAGQFVETGGEAVKGDGGQARYLVVAGVSPDDSVSPDLANGNHALYQGVGAVNDLSQAYEFDTLQDAIVSTIVLPVGKVLNLKERSTGNGGGATWDVVLASSVTVNGDTIVACTGVVTLALVMREQIKPTLKFTFQEDTRGEQYLALYNDVDDIAIVSWADGTSSGQAHVQSLPTDIRRDSHAMLATAGSVGGSHDISWRTSGYSDYFYYVGNTTLGNENMQFSFDTKPARNDGTKKDGTGGGGLTPSEDSYAFDAAMYIPSNGVSRPIQFMALGIQANQYVEYKKRSGSTATFRATPNAGDLTLTEEVTGNILSVMYPNKKVEFGKTTFLPDGVNTNLAGGIGNFKISLPRFSLSSGASVTYTLSRVSDLVLGKLRVTATGSGGGFGIKDVSFNFDGTTLLEVATQPTTLIAQLVANIVNNAGVLELQISYAGGYGGAGRFAIDLEWEVITT